MSKGFIGVFAALGFLMLFAGDLAAQSSRSSVTASEVTGTFRMNFNGRYKGQSNEIKILALGRGKVRFAMDLVYPYTLKNGDLMVNMGGLDDEAAISGDTATYTSGGEGKCTITIRFVRPGTIKVVQQGSDGECGFGHNVFADGTYKKTSTKKPRFDEDHL